MTSQNTALPPFVSFAMSDRTLAARRGFQLATFSRRLKTRPDDHAREAGRAPSRCFAGQSGTGDTATAIPASAHSIGAEPHLPARHAERRTPFDASRRHAGDVQRIGGQATAQAHHVGDSVCLRVACHTLQVGIVTDWKDRARAPYKLPDPPVLRHH